MEHYITRRGFLATVAAILPIPLFPRSRLTGGGGSVVDRVPAGPGMQPTLPADEPGRGDHRILPSGFTELDAVTGGFHKGDLVIVGATPRMGTTMFAINLLRNMCVHRGHPAVFFSLEKPETEISTNLVSSVARVEPYVVSGGYFSAEQHLRVSEAVAIIDSKPIFVDDERFPSQSEVLAKVRQLRSQVNVELIVIDYLQDIFGVPTSTARNRLEEVSETSRALKDLARELDVPVIAFAELRTAGKGRSDHRPRISDLRQSGSIEPHADLVLLLHREAEYVPDKLGAKNRAQVIVAQNGHGPTGAIELAYFGNVMRIDNVTA